MQVDNTCNKLQTLHEYIDDTEVQLLAPVWLCQGLLAWCRLLQFQCLHFDCLYMLRPLQARPSLMLPGASWSFLQTRRTT
jgi:hypothetical protein